MLSSAVVVATLVANPATAQLSDARIVRSAQGVAGFDQWRWLDEGVAADLFFNGQVPAIRLILEDAFAGEPIDVIVQPAGRRAKGLLVADMDFDPDRPGMRRRTGRRRRRRRSGGRDH